MNFNADYYFFLCVGVRAFLLIVLFCSFYFVTGELKLSETESGIGEKEIKKSVILKSFYLYWQIVAINYALFFMSCNLFN